MFLLLNLIKMEVSAWREDFVNNNNIEASGIEVDAEGNTYFTGEFEGQVTFNTTPNSTTFDGGQFNDVFVAKLNSEGNLLWAKEFDNPSFTDEAEDIVVDKDSNSYFFMTSQGSEGDDNVVLTKLDKSDGSEVWKKTFGDFTNYVVAEGIAIDNQDNIFIAGEFEGQVAFGSTNIDSEDGNVFVTKLDSEGDVVWAKDFNSGEDDFVEVEGIAVDDTGNTYVTGYYESESMSVGNFMLYDEGGEGGEGEDAFIAKLDSKGEVKWAQNIGGMNAEEISDIAVNENKIYLAGEFYKEATFGDKNLTINNLNLRDTFLVKLEEKKEDKPEVSLSVDSTTITEANSNKITYTFTRKGDFTSELTVDFSVSGSATFKDDYTLTGADDGFDGSKGKVTFKAGASTATVTLNIVDDSDAEENETVGLELAMGSGYMLSATEAKTDITITKDEKDVVISTGSDDDDDDDDDDNEGELSFTSKAKSTFKFKSKFKDGKSKSSIKFSFKSKSIEEIQEIAFFTVDDDEGTIDGISPDAEGYLDVALNRAQSILSVLGNAPQGFDLTTLDKVLEFSSDKSFRFFSVKGGTLDGVKKGKIKSSQVTFSSEVSEFGKNDFDLDFAGVKIKMKLDGKAKKAIGSGLQETIEVIDLRSNELSGKQKVKCTVNREAAFDNLVGFFQVTDEDGGIDTNGDGTADILVGDAGYAEAAVQNRIASIDLSVENQSTGNFTGEFEAGAIVVPFLIVDGTIDNFTDVFFPFIGANSDGADHVMMLADNTFGFEDLVNGGDRDFNDITVKIDFIVST